MALLLVGVILSRQPPVPLSAEGSVLRAKKVRPAAGKADHDFGVTSTSSSGARKNAGGRVPGSNVCLTGVGSAFRILACRAQVGKFLSAQWSD